MAREEREERPRRDRGERGGRDREDRGERSELVDKLVHINRVAKVVKGGKRFGFEAVRKATEAAKKQLVRVPLREGRTLHHEVLGRHGAGKVVLRPAPVGTGIIAGGPLRAVFDVLGVHDVVAKSVGSSNPYNMVRATFDALKGQNSPKMIANKRGKSVAEVISSRRSQSAAEVSPE
jgi:small subunit ribosomal protein S5